MEKLALFGGKPVGAVIPSWPVHDERDEQAVIDVVRSGNYGGYPEPAPHAARFAADFAAMHDARYGIACANGTITMVTALLAAGVGWGDEVLIPALAFAAVAWAPLSIGAVPIICDIDPDTFCISPQAIEAAITARTRAIIAVHLGATIADLDAISAIAQKHNLVFIEDCAHAHAGQWEGRGVGSWGHFGSFSMQLSKTLTSGEGGLITTNDPALAEACHSLIDCGRAKDDARQNFRLGANYRITELQAALLEVGLTRLLDQQATRARNMAAMDARLRSFQGMAPQWVDPRITRRPTYVYITRFDPAAFGGINSTQFAEALVAEGFPVSTGNPPMHRYDLLRLTDQNSATYRNFKDRLNFGALHYPVAEEAARTTLWVAHPLFMGDASNVDRFAEAIEKVRENAADLQNQDLQIDPAGVSHLRT
jgi:dTDP-4-amino-4,6-dideoxygalactose transaminase